MRSLVFVSLISISFVLPAAAAEPQWIWRHKDAATEAEKETVYFRKSFDVETPDGGFIEITADNRCEVYLNSRRVGSGDDWRQRFKFDVGPLLLPGRNLIAVSATNAQADSAGLVVHLVAKDKGRESVEVFSDASWKWSTKVPGTWTRVESDDSQWDQSVELGAYGQTAPWGAAGPIVDGKPAFVIPSKPRSREKGLFEFRDSDRVVFLGSAFIERLQNTGYLETMITAAFPRKKITFRNLGWSGDNVWGDARAGFGTRAEGFQRLVSDVTLCDPTVLIVCYGENEAHAGEAGLEGFRAGLNTLLDSLEATGARIVLFGPRQHENLGPPLPDPAKYNVDLRKYNDVIGKVAKEREHTFIELYGFRADKKDTENGIHLNEYGDWRVSWEIMSRLTGPLRGTIVRMNVKNMAYDVITGSLGNVAITPNKVSFDVKSRYVCPIPFPSVELEYDPATAAVKIAQLGPDDDQFRLSVDGIEVTTGSATQWAEGLEFSNPNVVKQMNDLRRAINEKNTLFFHRYRPQNETYLFLFRKHEQGNNAVEIPQFDPLIDELEKKIDELKQPVKQKFELIKVK